MDIVTRFNPSTNGNLHLGHVYSLLVNEHFAHDKGGKFIVRFDDESPIALAIPEDRRERLIESQRDDILWLGIRVDEWQWQSKLHHKVMANLELVGHETMKDAGEGQHILPLVTRTIGTGWVAYPYVPQQTAERVMMDHMIGATHIIRGEEFFGEFSLYSYFCERFNFKTPEFIFLPRLTSKHGDISKTCGGYTLIEFRGSGYTAGEVKNLIAKAALYWTPSKWELHNLRPNPQLNL